MSTSTPTAALPGPYWPLSSPSNIRVMRLQPAKEKTAPLRCELHEIGLESREGNETAAFIALSYVWGSPLDRTVKCGDHEIPVTPNCKAALQAIRDAKSLVSLWVDAICINQKDVELGVYRSAQCVYVWLGDGNLAIWTLFQRLTRMKYYRGIVKNVNDVEFGMTNFPRTRLRMFGMLPRLEDMEEVLAHPWFFRVWTSQEIAMARDCEVLYDDVIKFSPTSPPDDESRSRHGSVTTQNEEGNWYMDKLVELARASSHTQAPPHLDPIPDLPSWVYDWRVPPHFPAWNSPLARWKRYLPSDWGSLSWWRWRATNEAYATGESFAIGDEEAFSLAAESGRLPVEGKVCGSVVWVSDMLSLIPKSFKGYRKVMDKIPIVGRKDRLLETKMIWREAQVLAKIRLFLTDSGHLGITRGVWHVEEVGVVAVEDEFALLSGCHTPVLLRRRSEDRFDFEETATPSFHFRGVAYISGFMAGEFWDKKRKPRKLFATFTPHLSYQASDQFRSRNQLQPLPELQVQSQTSLPANMAESQNANATKPGQKNKRKGRHSDDPLHDGVTTVKKPRTDPIDAVPDLQHRGKGWPSKVDDAHPAGLVIEISDDDSEIGAAVGDAADKDAEAAGAHSSGPAIEISDDETEISDDIRDAWDEEAHFDDGEGYHNLANRFRDTLIQNSLADGAQRLLRLSSNPLDYCLNMNDTQADSAQSLRHGSDPPVYSWNVNGTHLGRSASESIHYRMQTSHNPRDASNEDAYLDDASSPFSDRTTTDVDPGPRNSTMDDAPRDEPADREAAQPPLRPANNAPHYDHRHCDVTIDHLCVELDGARYDNQVLRRTIQDLKRRIRDVSDDLDDALAVFGKDE
ncbi:heterokaryon incompatibility protein-domain-containing protein [Xylariomycetidae sp. FL0641]|nr:heterokaryon incompatibility protein-domain-containing protein [Xylariomycetidae sp. FL0641]